MESEETSLSRPSTVAHRADRITRTRTEDHNPEWEREPPNGQLAQEPLT